MYSSLTEKEKGGILEIQKPIGAEELFISGDGLDVEYDSRNRSLYPTKGK